MSEQATCFYTLVDLVPHPSQPPERTRDTTDLQEDMAKHGQLVPIKVASDGKTVLSGWRRCTAAKALGWSQIEGFPSTTDASSPEAIDHLVAYNNQAPLTAMQLVAILQDYESHGVDFRKACRRCGIKSAKARTLAALVHAPPEVQEAVNQFDRGDQSGMSLSAFAQMQHLPGAKQLEILRQGKTSKRDVYRATKREKRVSLEQRLVDDAGSTDAMLTMAHSLGAQAMCLATWLDKATPDDADLVQIAYSSALPALRKLIEGG